MRITGINTASNLSCTNKKYEQNFKGLSKITAPQKALTNSIKIIFSDIDGTISEHSDLLSKKTIDSINFLHKKGIPVVLTTARCYQDTLPIIEQFSHNPDYTITLQGGSLINNKGIPFFENVISPKAAKKLVTWFNSIRKKDKNSHLIMYFNEHPYSTSKIQFPWKAKFLIEQVPSFDNLLKNNKLHKAVIYKTDVKNYPNYNQKAIIDSFNNAHIPDLKINSSGPNLLEFQNKWVSKDKAIDFLLRSLKINPQNAMVIGDSSNDIEMLDFVRGKGGLAVAMGNAHNSVKQHANAITSSVTQDGFSNIIEKLFSKGD